MCEVKNNNHQNVVESVTWINYTKTIQQIALKLKIEDSHYPKKKICKPKVFQSCL